MWSLVSGTATVDVLGCLLNCFSPTLNTKYDRSNGASSLLADSVSDTVKACLFSRRTTYPHTTRPTILEMILPSHYATC